MSANESLPICPICNLHMPINAEGLPACTECSHQMLDLKVRNPMLCICVMQKGSGPAYGKPPEFTAGEFKCILAVMSGTAWLKDEWYDDFKTAVKKLREYVGESDAKPQ